MIEREEVIDRLKDGNRGLQISSESRREHEESMEDLLMSFERANKQEKPRRVAVPVLLRNAAVLVLAFAFGVFAAAYSDGVPGDPFYRAKRAAERPAQIVDPDIVASNRVGELGELIERGADPNTVVVARSEAARAILNSESDETTKRALSLLAWPGALDGLGVDVAPTNGGLLITSAEWFNEQGYTASLADGYLVTISALDGDILIGTTGDWTVVTTGVGWQLTNQDLDQVYFIQRQDQDLRVNSMAAGEGGARRSSGPDQVIVAVQDSEEPTDRARFGDPATTLISVDGSGASSGQQATTGGSDSESAGQGASGTTSANGDGTTTTPRVGQTTSGSNGGPTSQTTATRPPTTNAPTTSRPQPPTSSQSTTGPAPTTAVTTQTTTIQTTTTTQPTTTVPQAIQWDLYLQNPGQGNTSSSRTLPLSNGGPPSGSLVNFDTDRDSSAGLLIQKDGGGLGISDRTKTQEWVFTSSGTSTLNGDATLTIWMAAKDFKTDERIGVLASLELCNQGCTRLGTAQWSGSGSAGFRSATLGFGQVDGVLADGATLRLKVVVPDSLATTDVVFAYDSAAYPSRLSID